MTLWEQLSRHSIGLLGNPGDQRPLLEVQLRRSISAAYYALFHRMAADAASTIAPHVDTKVNHRIQRWFDHGELKKICGRFSARSLEQPLHDLIGTVSPDLRLVARAFVQLQSARHNADYNLDFTPGWDESRTLIELSIEAIAAWERIHQTAEANIFILSLLLWKNWERERP